MSILATMETGGYLSISVYISPSCTLIQFFYSFDKELFSAYRPVGGFDLTLAFIRRSLAADSKPSVAELVSLHILIKYYSRDGIPYYKRMWSIVDVY